MSTIPIQLTYATHFHSQDSVLQTSERSLVPMVQALKLGLGQIWTEKNQYRLYHNQQLVFQTDDLHLAVSRYTELINQQPEVQEPYVEGAYHYLDVISGKIRLTGYFNDEAVYTLQQEKPGMWSVLFTNPENNELGPLKQAQHDLTQLLDQCPTLPENPPVKIPLMSFYLNPPKRDQPGLAFSI